MPDKLFAPPFYPFYLSMNPEIIIFCLIKSKIIYYLYVSFLDSVYINLKSNNFKQKNIQNKLMNLCVCVGNFKQFFCIEKYSLKFRY